MDRVLIDWESPMTKQGRIKTQHCVRPIKTKRDFERVTAVVKRLADKSERDTAAELRLQLMLKELDKFDPPEDDADADLSVDDDYPRSGRRWSDETSDRE
jgi:hypothetical protein